MNRLRRAAILAGGAALLPTPTRTQAAEADEPAPIEVARGVFMWRGASGEPDASNRGRVGNAGFVVGERGVLAIDSGTSYREGRALLAGIARTTDRPLRRLVLTHARQEFVFGAQAFRERGIGMAMQRDTAELMAARCAGCLERLVSLLGEDEMRGTVLVEPDLRFAQTHDIDAAGIGRRLRVLTFGHSSGPGDAAVLDVQGGTLFAGGLLDAKRIPDLQDADLAGWRRALAALRTLAPATIVPGHGPAAPANLIYAIERYLVQLDSRVRALARANAPLSEVPDATALAEFDDWDGYGTIHRRNASLLFLRLEREGFDR
jgi:glyoxylase-like metal-dependent hydrolase (beta-lactamase superfamily II)